MDFDDPVFFSDTFAFTEFPYIFAADLGVPLAMCECSQHQDSRPFSFMCLPAELRVEIYRYALLPGRHIVLREDLPCIASLRYQYNEALSCQYI
jgi:hypothetical protein